MKTFIDFENVFFFNMASGGLYFSICLLWHITSTLITGYRYTHECAIFLWIFSPSLLSSCFGNHLMEIPHVSSNWACSFCTSIPSFLDRVVESQSSPHLPTWMPSSARFSPLLVNCERIVMTWQKNNAGRGFEPTISRTERWKTDALDRSAVLLPNFENGQPVIPYKDLWGKFNNFFDLSFTTREMCILRCRGSV